MFNNVHWNLYCEWNNVNNSDIIKDFYQRIYLEFMSEAEK